jgi:hypothetical protein
MTGHIVHIVFSPFTNSSILFRYNKSYYRIDLIIGVKWHFERYNSYQSALTHSPEARHK